jgi:hypothetical protein
MSTDQPDDKPADELADDAGVNAIRLDAERAREDLDKTLSEIERRLDPQRIIQPVKRAVLQTASAIRTEFHKDPVRFVTVTVLTISAVGVVLTWAGGGFNSAKATPSSKPGLPAKKSSWEDPRVAQSTSTKKTGKPTKPSEDPVFRNANKVSKRAVLSVVKAHL